VGFPARFQLAALLLLYVVQLATLFAEMCRDK
jgi:hypothetical protein